MKRAPLVYALLVLYTFGPLLPMLLASGIASSNGCELNEAAVHPCVVWGRDIGGALTSMFVGAWLVLFTLPTSALAIIIFSIFIIFLAREAENPTY